MTAECPSPNAPMSNAPLRKLLVEMLKTTPSTGARNAKVHGPSPTPKSKPNVKAHIHPRQFVDPPEDPPHEILTTSRR